MNLYIHIYIYILTDLNVPRVNECSRHPIWLAWRELVSRLYKDVNMLKHTYIWYIYIYIYRIPVQSVRLSFTTVLAPLWNNVCRSVLLHSGTLNYSYDTIKNIIIINNCQGRGELVSKSIFVFDVYVVWFHIYNL